MLSFLCLVFTITFGVVYCSEYILDPEDCVLYSQNHSIIIDLQSGFSEDTSVMANNTVYISLCPKMHRKCPKNSFICLQSNTGNSKPIDIGSRITSITYEGSFIIQVESPNGRGTIFISCDNSLTSFPIFLLNSPEDDFKDVMYNVKWMSRDACGIKQYKSENSCVLYTKDFSYDLRPLQYLSDHKAYHDSDEYSISICRDLNEHRCGQSSVCVNRKGSYVPIAMKEGSVLQFISSRGLTLKYRNIDGGSTVITFECSLVHPDPLLEFLEFHDRHFSFKISSSVTCPPPKMDCLIKNDSSGEYTYDLRMLHLLHENIEFKLDKGQKLIINVCGTINYMPNIFCTGSLNFACLIDSSNKTIAEANTSSSKIISSGHVAFKISGNSKDKPLFLNVIFECSSNDVHPYLTDSSHHNYTVIWKTATACPSKIHQGENCRVRNLFAEDSLIVDLNNQHKSNSDYIVFNGNESFRINVCGYLNRTCSKTKESSVCYKTAEGKELSIGETGNFEPVFNDGQFMFYLEGEPCNEKVTRSKIRIILSCEVFQNNSAYKNINPEYIVKAQECEFFFYWRTDQICKNLVTSECSIQDGYRKFNLTSLINLKENYIVPLNNSKGSEHIVLNVCHSILPGHNIRCLPSDVVGACLVHDRSDYALSKFYEDRRKFERLGLVSKKGNLELNDGKLSLRYTEGGICESRSHGSQDAIINFECNSTANDTGPVLEKFENCSYIFHWITSAACPITIPTGRPSIDKVTTTHRLTSVTTTTRKPPKNSCSVFVPRKNKLYDLSSLMGKDWDVNDRMTISVCRPVQIPECPQNSGACLRGDQLEKSKTLGDYNDNLEYVHNSLLLHYKSHSYQTTIEFICSKGNFKPILMKTLHEANTSHTFISWPVSLACDKKVEETCCNQISGLCSLYDRTYEVAVNKNEVAFLRLCQPVVPRIGLLCTDGTPACIGSKRNSSSFYNEKILGKDFEVPKLLKNEVIINYSNGSVCNKNPNSKYSASIRFTCDDTTLSGYPKFVKSSNDCHYEFLWGTDLLCHHSDTNECLVHVNKNNSAYSCDMLQLSASNIFINGNRGNYILNLCNIIPRCEGYICSEYVDIDWHHIQSRNITTSLTNTSTTINYFNPSKTDNDKCGARVDLVYSGNQKENVKTSLKEESDCYIHIEIQNAVVCASKSSGQDTVTVKESSSAAWYVIPILLILVLCGGLFYWIRSRGINVKNSFQHVMRYKREGDTDILQL